MSKKVTTMKVGSADYAKVKDRIKEFRTDCPFGLIETTPTFTDDGIMFKVRILKDKSDPNSAEATGHSFATTAKNEKEKQFEKQESIAVGRALAFLGYASDGEIATGEEMEEYLKDKQDKLTESIMEVTETIGNCTTLDELKTVWSGLTGEMKTQVKQAQEAKKIQLQNENN